jgi:hypothetical protein
MRRSRRNQEQLDIQGRDADGDVSESLRAFIWQPLGLLIIVKPPALRERHDFCIWLHEQLGRPRLALADLVDW